MILNFGNEQEKGTVKGKREVEVHGIPVLFSFSRFLFLGSQSQHYAEKEGCVGIRYSESEMPKTQCGIPGIQDCVTSKSLNSEFGFRNV